MYTETYKVITPLLVGMCFYFDLPTKIVQKDGHRRNDDHGYDVTQALT